MDISCDNNGLISANNHVRIYKYINNNPVSSHTPSANTNVVEIEEKYMNLIFQSLEEIEGKYGSATIQYDRACWVNEDMELEFMFLGEHHDFTYNRPIAELYCYAVLSDSIIEGIYIGMPYDDFIQILGEPKISASHTGHSTLIYNTQKDDVDFILQFHYLGGVEGCGLIKREYASDLFGGVDYYASY